MSTLKEIEFKVLTPLNGGEVFDNAKLPQGREVWSRIDACRGTVLPQIVAKSPMTVIDDNWLQEFTPVYDAAASSGKPYNVFSFYDLVGLSFSQALFWAGKQDRITQFNVLDSMGEMSTYGMHSATDPRATQSVVCVPRGRTLLVYNKDIKSMITLCVFANPREVTGYNINTSTYPVCQKTENIIIKMVQQELSIAFGIPLNYENNGANNKDLATIPVIPK